MIWMNSTSLMRTMTNNERLHAIVHGRVQGVSFRYYAAQEARSLKVKGWVRNRPNGTVETVAEGSRVALDQFVAFLHQGSPSAHVSQVDLEWLAAENQFRHFEITY